MAEYTLYAGPAGTGRLEVTARPGKSSGNHSVWLVTFSRWGQRGKMLDQCAVWRPTLCAWDRWRWHPIGSRLVPPAVLADVEAWLRGREVPSIEPTTTEAP